MLKDLKPVTPQKIEAVPPFGKGPRLYVGGVPDPVSESRVREHFAKWGSVSDVYFPGARGQKRLNYCFVTFDNQLSAECACSESDRNLDGWVSFFCTSVTPTTVASHCPFIPRHMQ